ncbi:MAG: phosphoribosylformylglycinamidine cyclo-ligase, partial [Myxococcales bacterium]|nr:phosphoribosylformylglycinamidine cyclo-ligase [Myxococcales bacterium]
FLDYVAAAKLDPAQVAEVVTGMAEACRAAGCALLGGETAEMPGVYAPGEVDVAGTIVGAVDRAAIIDGRRIAAGDAVLGLASSGPHTNGYSLVHKLVGDRPLDVFEPALAMSPLDALLMPHRSYLDDVLRLRAEGIDVRGLAHITGGGLIENPPRILPPGLAIRLDRQAWAVPPLFRWLAALGPVAPAEMHRVFNMGLGLLIVVPAAQAEAALRLLHCPASIVGRVEPRVEAPVVFDPPLPEKIA